MYIDDIKENKSKMRLFNKGFCMCLNFSRFCRQEKMVIKNVERLLFKIAEKCVSA
jgi:hypothetical protein